jgi:chitin disaccharide deacetylase
LPRPLTIVADDYGIGRETSRGILDLACERIITATVMIVNSPDAERATSEWLAAKPPADLGWHPNLTLDRPLLPAAEVPSLVRSDGTFWPLGGFLKRACLGKVHLADVRNEWRAQYRRFVDFVGRPPDLVNSHQHVSLFPPCDRALLEVLEAENARPYLRRVVERGEVIVRVPGARIKRAVLSTLGRRAARKSAAHGLPGCDWLIGVTDPVWVADERYLERWVNEIGNRGSVEVCCHPGYEDHSLVGRDCDAGDGLLRRQRETDLLRSPLFRTACADAGLVPVRPTTLMRRNAT